LAHAPTRQKSNRRADRSTIHWPTTAENQTQDEVEKCGEEEKEDLRRQESVAFGFGELFHFFHESVFCDLSWPIKVNEEK
jgi:hypothetical protein